jgi:16S rRNA (cytidine1402-2'-O)-methyltransferase
VHAARAAGIRVTPIPGPSAMTTRVSASGLPSNRVLFVGFLPTKDKALKAELQSWAATGATVVFFESARRLEKTLAVMQSVLPHATVVIGRELTKLYEEIVNLPVAEALVWCQCHASLRGEVAVAVDVGAVEKTAAAPLQESLRREIGAAFKRGATLKDLLGQYRDKGLGRAELYALLLDVKSNGA